MEEFLGAWFVGFGEGLDALDESARTTLLSACGRRCAESGPLATYRAMFRAADGDLDAFFRALNRLDNVHGVIIEPGRVYEIQFPRCTCDLVTNGYVRTPKLCECSRQSILHVFNTLLPRARFRVERVATILDGAPSCRFRLLFLKEK